MRAHEVGKVLGDHNELLLLPLLQVVLALLSRGLVLPASWGLPAHPHNSVCKYLANGCPPCQIAMHSSHQITHTQTKTLNSSLRGPTSGAGAVQHTRETHHMQRGTGTSVQLGLCINTNHVCTHKGTGHGIRQGDQLLFPQAKLLGWHDEAQPQGLRCRGAQMVNGGLQARSVHRVIRCEGHLVRALARPNRVHCRLRRVHELHEGCGVHCGPTNSHQSHDMHARHTKHSLCQCDNPTSAIRAHITVQCNRGNSWRLRTCRVLAQRPLA
jgi:hypothetical protein